MSVGLRHAIALVLLASCDQTMVLALHEDSQVEAPRDHRVLAPGWAIALGSIGNAIATGVAALPDGSIAIAGQFSGDPDRILGTSVTAETPWGVFVSRVDKEGRPLWTVSLPGPGTFSIWPTAGGIAVDAAGNIYIGDAFSGRATFGATTRVARGETDLYVAKLGMDGRLLWTTVAGGDGTDRVHRIAVDPAGMLTITGTFAGSVSFGGTTLQAAGMNDVLVARLSPQGEFAWATRAGGVHDGGATGEFGNGLVLDRHGNAYVAARFTSAAEFDGLDEVKKGGPLTNDTFVTKLDDHGRFRWARAAPFTRIEVPTGLALDGSGDLHLSGLATMQAILCKLTSAGSFHGKCTVTACGAEAFAAAVLANPDGGTTIAGQLAAPCPFGLSAEKGPVDAFVARLDPLGSPAHIERMGGPGATCRAHGLARASSGELYVVGSFSGAPSVGDTTLKTRGKRDGFIWKIPAPEP